MMEGTTALSLATFLQRLLAYILDTVMFSLPLSAGAGLLAGRLDHCLLRR